ncbi:hypothetical protein HN992_00530 [Candidatus Woesearchaeota archaeon]|jgi:hypothetical protein|nr:hypothetical protein [Candidatus Woesearchaeota archaeon]MBT3438380.1 hypothetical protein [Candidatus Woesearchaeota archaeon]MBT4058365.1 hypothetical protein [Candidatus Woesearchaeota archaeon]MBT4207611.1 hypothetical protein [Candidatus Woesearchaeota archaeon]MBT4730626.1 hypothetical protein [Candidatus Woesearchaeota archaeon]
MSFKRYGLITDKDEKYYMEYCESPDEYGAFKIPLKLGANRFNPSKYHNHWRRFHNGRNYEEKWYNVIGFIPKEIDFTKDFQEDIFQLINGRYGISIEEFMRDESTNYRTMENLETLESLIGSRLWLLKEGKYLTTANNKILRPIKDIFEFE